MGLHNFDAEMPSDFGNRVRLFPLPNLVLFPNMVQALHIFEPRYCEMLLDSLADDRLIAMALLKPGWEVQLGNRPSIAEVVCIGKIVSHAPAEGQRHNILLAGLRRAKIVQEEPMLHPYRTAIVEVIEDIPCNIPPSMNSDSGEFVELDEASEMPSGNSSLENLRKMLGESLRSMLKPARASEATDYLLSRKIPLGILSDIVAYSSQLPVEIKQQLLSEANVEARCRLLLHSLDQMAKVRSNSSTHAPFFDGFLPRFSDN